MNPEIKSSERILEVENGAEKIPVTKFQIASIEQEAEMIPYFMRDGGSWREKFIKRFPKLQEIEEGSKDDEEKLGKYKNLLEVVHNEENEKINEGLEKVRVEWEKINEEFLLELSRHFETSWPADKEICANVSVLPVYPRHLDDYSFFTGYKNISSSIETSAHEIVHFLWFKKWKEVFPEMERKEYENPNLAWRLSEVIDPIILQCNPKIKELIKPKTWGYSTFEAIKIGEVGLIEYFKKIYLDSVNSGDSFDVTMKKLWDESQKHEEELRKF